MLVGYVACFDLWRSWLDTLKSCLVEKLPLSILLAKNCLTICPLVSFLKLMYISLWTARLVFHQRRSASRLSLRASLTSFVNQGTDRRSLTLRGLDLVRKVFPSGRDQEDFHLLKMHLLCILSKWKIDWCRMDRPSKLTTSDLCWL